MDPQKTIHIKQEETDCAPDERGLMSYGTQAMDYQQATYIKQEETDCVPDEPGLTSYGARARDHQQTTEVKEEETDCAPSEPGFMFPEDPLKPEVPGLSIKPDPELKFHFATSENDSYGTLAMDHQQTTYIKEEETDCTPDDPGLLSVEYSLDTSWTTDFIKEEPPLNLDAEDTANIVVASRNYASNSTRLLRNESCHISIEETVNQGLVHSELQLHPKKSMHFPMIGGAEEEGGDQGDSVMEQSEEPCSSMAASKTLWTSFNDTCNTTINDNADIIDIYDKDGTAYTTGNINAHNRLLPLKRPRKCDVCGKCFSDLSQLKRHTLIHSGTKPHNCDICGKSFSRVGNLKTHTLIHSGIKPHKCDICGKSFSQLGSLKTHGILHTGMSPFKCVICGKYFSQLRSLKRHKLIHYGTILRK